MSASQLADTTMDIAHRQIRRITLEDIPEVAETFSKLMGKDVEARRTFISERALDVDEQLLDI
jgi:DNA gyrase subunit B